MVVRDETGEGCETLHDQPVHDLSCKNTQPDEIWAFVKCKQKRSGGSENIGDQYTFTAIDRGTKLALCWRVGKRNWSNAMMFYQDAKDCLRASCKPQMSSEAFTHYADCQGKVISIETHRVIGRPNKEQICTSHVERQNFTMRMSMRRFTRLTNGFSMKLDNLKAAVALHFMHTTTSCACIRRWKSHQPWRLA